MLGTLFDIFGIESATISALKSRSIAQVLQMR